MQTNVCSIPYNTIKLTQYNNNWNIKQQTHTISITSISTFTFFYEMPSPS